MIKQLFDWLDDRTGYRTWVQTTLYESVPGGARWRYVWGSTLIFTFMVQMITGFFLWASYSPSSQTAWESVYYIQHQMSGGWLLRGIHHFTAQAMIVLVAVHMVQVIWDGAYRAPREVNFWIGLILLQILLGLSLTGYLLPWDQKGYWATKVATNIAGIIPVIGPAIQKIVIGGPDYGHHTLTRFFALHAGLLPASMVVFIVAHVYVFRRHGLHHKEPKAGPDSMFWVDQVFKDAVACLGVLVVVVALCMWPRLTGHGIGGADLGAPANPAEEFKAARPEWYFLFLFQFLKFKAFAAEKEIIGAIVIPGAVMGILFLMPIVGRRQWGHRFNQSVMVALFIGIAALTLLAKLEDHYKPEYHAAVKQADKDAERVVALANAKGIPVEGANGLLAQDAMTQGPRLFAQHCASCHRFEGHNGLGLVPDSKESPQTAADLKGFASRDWLTKMFKLVDEKKPDGPRFYNDITYFGGTKFKSGKMSTFVHNKAAKYDKDEQEALRKILLALSAEAKLPAQVAMDAKDSADISAGLKLWKSSDCIDCHIFNGVGDEPKGPELTGYGSKTWLTGFIADPSHEKFYAKRNDRMPAFGVTKQLDQKQIGLIADWLRGDWFEPSKTATKNP